MNFVVKREKKWTKIGIVCSLLFIERKTFTILNQTKFLDAVGNPKHGSSISKTGIKYHYNFNSK